MLKINSDSMIRKEDNHLIFKIMSKIPEQFNKSEETENAEKNKIIENSTSGALPSIENTNPLENKPNLNPVSKTNPYKNIKTNPFE